MSVKRALASVKMGVSTSGSFEKFTVNQAPADRPEFYLQMEAKPMIEIVFKLTHWGRGKMAVTLADNTFKCKFVNENIWISIKVSLKCVPKGPINNMPALV